MKTSAKSIVAELKKKFKENTDDSIKLASDSTGIEGYVSTGSIIIDELLGTNGYPSRRVCEIYGNEGCGKTTMAILSMIDAQKKGLTPMIIDAESTFTEDYARALGLDTNDVIRIQPESAENATEMINTTLSKHTGVFVVLDSIPALVPKPVMESVMGSYNVGTRAKLISDFMFKVQNIISKQENCYLLCINQMRDVIGVSYGDSKITPGGTAKDYVYSVRLRLTKSLVIKDENQKPIGHTINVSVKKNIIGLTGKSAKIDLYYGKGFETIKELSELAVIREVITTKGGGSYIHGDVKIEGRGKEPLYQYVKSNFKSIKEQVFTVKK